MTIFLSYSHQDDVVCKDLEGILRLSEREGGKLWRDDQISPGDEFNRTISQQLQLADIIVLLLSPAFFASTYIPQNELEPALARHAAKTARVVPVILSEFDWKIGRLELAALQALPTGAKPISNWSSPVQALFDIARGLRKVAEELARPIQPTPNAQIALAADYKAVHEILHGVQFQCFVQLRSLAPRFPDDVSASADAEAYYVAIQSKVDELDAVALTRPELDINTALQYLRRVRDLLRTAVEGDDRKALERAIETLGTMLALFMPKFAAKLDEAAKTMLLPAEVKDLAASFASLLDEHRRWQAIDLEFRNADAALVRCFDEFLISWPMLKTSLATVCSGSSEAWATAMMDDLGKLAAAPEDANKFRRLFPRLRQRAEERFFKVDRDLKQVLRRMNN